MQKTNYLRPSVGVAVLAAPALPFFVALVHPHAIARRDMVLVAPFLVTGAAFAFLNFHLSFVRPWLHRRRHGSFAGYKFVSGIPMLGTLSICAAAYFGWGSIVCAALVLLITWVDTHSPPWCVIATWRDASFWDV